MTHTMSSGDFASATMMRVVAAGLARQGIEVPLRVPVGAHIPRKIKHDLLADVKTKHGTLTILRIADAAQHMPPEPVVQAMVKARTIEDMLDRWHRLERFSHGRHTVMSQLIGGDSFSMRHVARDSAPAPTEAETLLVLAILTAIAERVSGKSVSICDANGNTWRRNGVWSEGLSFPVSGEFVVSGEQASRRAGTSTSFSGTNLVNDLRQCIAADLLRRWTLEDLACAADMSARTLQRRLTGKSSTFSRLVAEARLQAAAAYLCDESGPCLAEIGFLAGYSDQAHFTRTFTKFVGTTPSAYRLDFAS